MYDLDYEKVGNITAIKKFPLAKKSLGLILEKGIFSTVYIEKYLEEMFKNKGKTKFKTYKFKWSVSIENNSFRCYQ